MAVVSIYDAASGIDLMDLSMFVGGREMEAYDAFQSVRQAPALEVTYLRENQSRTLRYAIVGAPSPALPKAPPAASAVSSPRPG